MQGLLADEGDEAGYAVGCGGMRRDVAGLDSAADHGDCGGIDLKALS
jgi:hypothetical protein